MSKHSPDPKQRCKAMIDAGIEDPDSREGALFCAGSSNDKIKSRCPYDYCIVFEHKKISKVRTVEDKTKFAIKLLAHGVSRDDIALILHVKRRTLQRYLRK